MLRPLNRDQLQKFLPDHQSIKAFEQMLDAIFGDLPNEDTANDAAAYAALHLSQTAYSEAQKLRSTRVLAWLSM